MFHCLEYSIPPPSSYKDTPSAMKKWPNNRVGLIRGGPYKNGVFGDRGLILQENYCIASYVFYFLLFTTFFQNAEK